jgi:trigger factor
LAPEVDFTISEKDKIPYYRIVVDDEERNKQIDRIASRYGAFRDADEVLDKEMIKADMVEVDKQGNPRVDGIQVEDVSISLEFVKDEKIKKKFKGLKTGDQLVIDVKKAFENETDLAALLKTEKEKLSAINPDFRLTLKSVSRFEKAPVNQELFDKVYGKETVKTEEEFRQKVDDELKSAFERNTYYLGQFKQHLPADFLKRWLLHTNEGKVTMEQIDKDFDHFVSDLKWQLIKGKTTRENELKYSAEELEAHVSEALRQQFIQYYGIAEVPADMLEKYAKESLAREEERNRYAESLNEQKVFEFIRKTVKLDNKEITLEKFNKLFEK